MRSLFPLVLGALVLAAPVSGQATPARPAEVTDSAIAAGRLLFQGPANCSRCHGHEGRGTAYGPDLADAIWWHGPGSYPWLVREVAHGIPEQLSVSGDPMPAKGRTPLNRIGIHAVAAYVWSISHPAKPSRLEPPRVE